MKTLKSFPEKLKASNSQIFLTFGGMLYLQLTTFIGLMLLSRNLPIADVGKYQLLLSIVVMLSLIGKLGLDEGISYYIPRYISKSPRKVLPIFGYSLIITLGLSVFLGSLVSIFAEIINENIFKMPLFEQELRALIFVLPSFSFLVVSLSGLRGVGRSDVRAYIYYFFLPTAFLISLFLVGLNSINVRWLILLRTGSFTIGSFVAVIFMVYHLGRSFEIPSFGDVRDLQRFSITVVFIGLMQSIVEQPLIDLALVSHFCSPDEVGRYSVASRLSALVAIGFNAITVVMGPRVSAIVNDGDVRQVKEIHTKIRVWLIRASLLMALGSVTCGDYLLALFGQEYVSAKPILVVFSLGYCLLAFGGLNLVFMLAYGLQKQELLLDLGSVVLMVGAGMILGRIFGPVGVATATVMSMVTLNFCRLFFLKKFTDPHE